jgi:hypothetical protein
METKKRVYKQRGVKHGELDMNGGDMPEKKEKKEKKMKENIVMPSYNDYALLKEGNNKYSLLQLKEICRFHKQKLTGKKEQLAENLYNYLYKSKYALVIQKMWRKYYIKIYNKMRGPARLQRSICVNETDFYTMEPLANIPYLQFFSYCDDERKKNKVVYGFDILSLFMLMKDEYGHTDEEMLKNPYTREPFPDNVKDTLFNLLKASKRFDDKIIIKVEEVKPLVAPTQNIRESIGIRTIAIFNDMNDLGNYTLSTWFSNLGHAQLVKFIRELYDIWTYRANLSDTVKREICPPYGSPFSTYLLNTTLLNGFPVDSIRLFVLELMEEFIRSGVNRDSRYLGTNYILCALTLVSNEAAEALPWLYQSVSYTLPF